MSILTAEQRGDLAEQMLPVAAHLAVLVHGDGGPEDVAEVLADLDDTQKNALLVVLAGLVDPEQPVGKALTWLDVTKHGALPAEAWMGQRPLREHAPEEGEELADDFVDWAAVTKFVKGFRVEVTDADFLAAVRQCAALGMTLADVNRLRGWPVNTAENWVNRLRKQHERSGRVFPSLAPPAGREFAEVEVVRMRERSAAGATDLELALSFDCDRKTVAAICRGRRYQQFGGPIREARNAKGVQASRQFMTGHSDNSQLGRKVHRVGSAA
ncbi:hypothetical protein ABZX39_33150 [Streptomyces collinus]|uniref:hypothetical protein n=1 Tax=Streptomyces collinus TaxID=42684 RepID=UPI0033B83615